MLYSSDDTNSQNLTTRSEDSFSSDFVFAVLSLISSNMFVKTHKFLENRIVIKTLERMLSPVVPHQTIYQPTAIQGQHFQPFCSGVSYPFSIPPPNVFASQQISMSSTTGSGSGAVMKAIRVQRYILL